MASPPDADPAQAVDGLVRAIRDLTSDPNYKLVADVFSEFLYVKEQNNKLSSSHQVVLEEYRKFRNELEEQKAVLDKEKRDMEVVIQEKSQEIMQLAVSKSKLEADLNDAHRAFEEEMQAAHEAAEKAAKEFATLKETMQREFSDMKATKEKEFAVLQAAKAAVEEQKRINDAAAAAAARDADEEIVQLTLAKNALQTAKTALEKAKAENESEIARLKERIETLEAQKKKLEEDLQAANKEIAELKGTLEQKNLKIESLEESLRVAEEQIASLQQTVEDKNAEIEELHGKLTAETVRAEKAEAQGQDLRIRLDDTERTLHDTEGRLEDLEQYRIEMDTENEDVYVAVLDKIWTTIVSLIEATFRPDIEEPTLSDASCWNNLRNSPYLKHATQLQIPLPQSNTPAAKGMRISAVLAVLSRALHRHIFRPVYLFDDDDENIVKFLRLLEDEDPTREAHMRATLLSAMPERQEEQAARRVKTVVREVSWLVQHLLSALQYEAFCSGLEAACKLACEQWMRIQVAQMKIEPYFGPPYDDFDWQVLDLPEFANGVEGQQGTPRAPEDTEVASAVHDDRLETIEASATPPSVSAAGGADNASQNGYDGMHDGGPDDEMMEGEVDPDEILLVVWPSMCCVENGELVSMTQGLVISKEQARPALEETRIKSKTIQRPGSRRARTMSMAAVSRGSSPQRKVPMTNHFMMAARALSDGAADEPAPTPLPTTAEA